MTTPKYYQLDSQEVFDLLKTSPDGLSEEEAALRLLQSGYNRLSEKASKSPLLRFLLQFHNLLIYILLIAATITALMQEWADTIVITGVVIINALIGFIQESKAEAALSSLKKMLSQQATVIRGGRQKEIPAEELVPGDVVLLLAGDRVPADMRLVSARNLQVDEAALTGESLPVVKQVELIEPDVGIADRLNMVFNGTFITTGQALGLVTATGDHSEIGKIASLLQDVEEIRTPLTRKLDAFSSSLTFFILAACLALYFAGTTLRDFPPLEMLMAVVAVAISAIPEGLPAIMTITLAIGVTRMARRNAIIRKLPAVETLGSTRIICTDKTGTLTRNEMAITRVLTPQGDFAVTGSGYSPRGLFSLEESHIEADDFESLIELLRAGTLCNDARLKRKSEEWLIEGDPTEAALVVAAKKAGLDQEFEGQNYPRLDLVPFESELQYMTTLNRLPTTGSIILIKGAPEKVISLCVNDWPGTDEIDAAAWLVKAGNLAAEGMRVLALASKQGNEPGEDLSDQDISEGGFTLLGLTGMIDPLRQEARDAVVDCRKAGVKVKMITGDHAQTAKAIAVELGLGSEVYTGLELDQLDDDAFTEVATRANVFARVSPAHKLRLVSALQGSGEVVAMTGDGVNDAPALKQADIGIAMGITGTEVTREAADMVITDDNFVSIERAMEEGRTVFTNLIKTIMFILPTNGGECLVIMWAILSGSLLPVLPLHILWINLVTTVALAITLAFEPIEKDTMDRPPRPPDAPIIEPYLLWRILLVSLIMAMGTFFLFHHARESGMPLEEARTIAVNTIVFFEIFYIFNSRYLDASVLSWEGLTGNPAILIGVSAVILFQIGFTYLPFLNQLFKSSPLDLASWLVILLVSFTVLPIIELEKLIKKKSRF